jgi:hypothetical protein
MSHQLQSQQDFLLYVPEGQMSACSTIQTSTINATADQPADFEDWVKIPLDETLVVYACLWNEQE